MSELDVKKKNGQEVALSVVAHLVDINTEEAEIQVVFFGKKYEVSMKAVEVNTMNFHNAVEAMKLGSKVRRLSWPAKRVFLHARNMDPDGDGKIIETVVSESKVIEQDSTLFQQWCPTIEDLESNDWWVVV